MPAPRSHRHASSRSGDALNGSSEGGAPPVTMSGGNSSAVGSYGDDEQTTDDDSATEVMSMGGLRDALAGLSP